MPIPELKIGGFTGITTIDFPGQLASVVFCQGCPWRCAYCHNPHLLSKAGEEHLEWSDVGAFMDRRKGLLDGIVFSGGEPTAQSGLIDAIQEMKDKGFLIGLHTAGPHPERLESLLPLLHWIALDIKAPFAAYEQITMAGGSGSRARRSANLILEHGIPHEFRTTVYPGALDDTAILTMAEELRQMGVKNYALQKYRPLNAGLAPGAFVSPETASTIGSLFDQFELRQ